MEPSPDPCLKVVGFKHATQIPALEVLPMKTITCTCFFATFRPEASQPGAIISYIHYMKKYKSSFCIIK